jgi:hypothetical protein
MRRVADLLSPSKRAATPPTKKGRLRTLANDVRIVCPGLSMKAVDLATLSQTMPMPEVATPPFAQVLAVFTIGNELAFSDMSHFLLLR